MDVVDQVRAVLSQIEAMGARVTLGHASTVAQIADAERAWGFELPAEYKEFLGTIGSIEIELVRTWFFYGLPAQARVRPLYLEEFAQFRDDAGDGGAYYPQRFVVLADEGDYSNAATGFVYDADLAHIRFTAGGDYMEQDEGLESGFWGFLSDELEEIRGRIADPDDVLVGGAEAEIARRRKLPS